MTEGKYKIKVVPIPDGENWRTAKSLQVTVLIDDGLVKKEFSGVVKRIS